jgi:hypothetical protein
LTHWYISQFYNKVGLRYIGKEEETMPEIPWERTVDGKPLYCRDERVKFFAPLAQLMGLAEEKISGVLAISAKFQDQLYSFEERVAVTIQTDTSQEFVGLYMVDEEIYKDRPLLCIRRIEWDREEDKRRFIRATNMRSYVASAEQFCSQIIFVIPEMYPEISSLLEELRQIFRGSIAMRREDRPTFPWVAITVEYSDGWQENKVYYVTRTQSMARLEKWIDHWRRYMQEINAKTSLVPDDGCIVVNAFDLERLYQFPEQSYQEWAKQKKKK